MIAKLSQSPSDYGPLVTIEPSFHGCLIITVPPPVALVPQSLYMVPQSPWAPDTMVPKHPNTLVNKLPRFPGNTGAQKSWSTSYHKLSSHL